jgi:pyridoxal phosphate enzyme (YggS family)
MFQETASSIEDRILAACSRAKRPRDSVQVLAVSKGQSLERIRQAYQHGFRDFAENYVQELEQKQALLGDLVDLRWHLIGALQSNKAARVAGRVVSFHALDSLRLAQHLSKAVLGKNLASLDVYVQVNLENEATKGGVSPSDAEVLARDITKLPGLRLIGLMAIPVPEANPERMRPKFQQMRSLAQTLGSIVGLTVPLKLSMGMSDDFEVAIEEGSSCIRLGRALLGERS